MGTGHVGAEDFLPAYLLLAEEAVRSLGFGLVTACAPYAGGGFVRKVIRQLVQSLVAQVRHCKFVCRRSAHRCSRAHYRGKERSFSQRDITVAMKKGHVWGG